MDKSVSDLLRRLAEKDKEIERLKESVRERKECDALNYNKSQAQSAVILQCKEALQICADSTKSEHTKGLHIGAALSVIGELEC